MFFACSLLSFSQMTDPPSVLKALLSSLWLSSWTHPNVPGINGKLKWLIYYWPAAFWHSSVQFTWISKILKSTEKIRMHAFYLSAPPSEVYAVIRTCICWPICLNTNKKAPYMIFTSISQNQGEPLLMHVYSTFTFACFLSSSKY